MTTDRKVVSIRAKAKRLRRSPNPDSSEYQRGFDLGAQWAEPLVFQLASEAPMDDSSPDPQFNLGILFGVACALRNCADELTAGRG